MALSPASRFIANRKKPPRVREKLYLVTLHPGEEPIPIVATGFKTELSGNLMLYHHGRIQVLHTWEALKEADFDNPEEREPDPAEPPAEGTEPA